MKIQLTFLTDILYILYTSPPACAQIMDNVKHEPRQSLIIFSTDFGTENKWHKISTELKSAKATHCILHTCFCSEFLYIKLPVTNNEEYQAQKINNGFRNTRADFNGNLPRLPAEG